MEDQKQIEELKKKLYQERFIFPDLGERAKNVRYEYDRLHRHVDYNKEENYNRLAVEPIAIECNGFSYLRGECVSILLSYIEELKDQVRDEREEKKKILSLVRG